mmetsp:Transcript_5349/g.14901  ORF Transcript_5349/g.14901 Transcript_5349/m.14901 type:complete len:326 (+) Transcript_5349:1-978(+)
MRGRVVPVVFVAAGLVWGLSSIDLTFAAARLGVASAPAYAAAPAALAEGRLEGLSGAALGRELGVARSARGGDAPLLPKGFDLTGKVALVTGASRGIGAAIAQRLAEAGATVVGTATSDSGAETISARFTGALKGKGMKLDVVDSANVEQVLNEIKAAYGQVDILVNNAGITKDTLMLRMKDSDWDDVINTNLNSVFRMTKAVLKDMTKARWGRIISISSVVGSMGNAGQANYAAAKAGMDGFSRALAREVGSRSITVNSLAPGFIKTDMTDGLKEEWKAKLLEGVPAGRLGTPEEIADAVLFLASPSSGYITGQTLHVNGGMYM